MNPVEILRVANGDQKEKWNRHPLINLENWLKIIKIYVFKKNNIYVNRRLMWAVHSWRKWGSTVKYVIKEDSKRKRPLGKTKVKMGRLREKKCWKDRARNHLERNSSGQGQVTRLVFHGMVLILRFTK